MNARSWIASSIVLLSLAPFARANHVLVVGGTGPHAQIQQAIDAAADGDVVLVKSGTYTTFQVLDKALAIVADDGATVDVVGAVRVRGVSATKDVVIAGIRAQGTLDGTDVQRHGLYVKNCDGSVRLQDCTFRGAPDAHCPGFTPCASCLVSYGALVEGSQDVAFERCALLGRSYEGSITPFVQPGTYWGGDGLFATSSSIAIHDALLRGGNGGVDPACSGYDDGGDGGAGMRVDGASFAFAARSSLLGGNGGPGTQFCGGPICIFNGSGGPAATRGPVGGGTGVFLDDAATGGTAGPCNTCFGTCLGYCNSGTGGGITGSGWTITIVPGASCALEAPRVAREGQTIHVVHRGTPGDEVMLVSSRGTSFAYEPFLHGVSLVQQRRRPYPIQQVGVIPPSGVLDTTWALPSDLGPGVEGATVFLQAIHRDASGRRVLSGLASVTLLDAAF